MTGAGRAAASDVTRHRRRSLDLEYAVAAADAAHAGAHGLEDQRTVDRLDESVELRRIAGQLDDERGFGDVDDAAAENVRHALQLLAVLAGGAHLDEHQL